MPGPLPKRSEERRRRNKDVVEVTKVDLETAIAGEVLVPEPEEDWHPVARVIWDSAQKSGQAIFYEPSDWGTLFLLCDQIARAYEPKPIRTGGTEEDPEFTMMILPMPGSVLSSIEKLMRSLMMSEGSRRLARIELERKAQRDAAASGGGTVVPISKQRAARFSRPAQM